MGKHYQGADWNAFSENTNSTLGDGREKVSIGQKLGNMLVTSSTCLDHRTVDLAKVCGPFSPFGSGKMLLPPRSLLDSCCSSMSPSVHPLPHHSHRQLSPLTEVTIDIPQDVVMAYNFRLFMCWCCLHCNLMDCCPSAKLF